MRRFIFFLIFTFPVIILSGCSAHKNNAKVIPDGRGDKISVNIDYSHLSETRKKIIEEAISWIGVPYKYGGNDRNGVDCSGLVLQVYDKIADIKLPRNSAKQAEFCKRIKKEDVKDGDLVFFATGKDPGIVSHVGIMIDEDRFIHSSTSRGVVVSRVSSDYYTNRLMLYGRVPGKF